MKKKQFDERQLRERGKGFRNGFVTAMAVMLAVYAMREFGWSFEPDGQFYLEFWIPVTVALMTFVLGDAIDGINGRGGRVIMSFYAITGIVLTVMLIIEHEPLIVGRTITSTAGAWMTAVAMVTMGAVYWGKQLRDRRRENDD